MRRVYQPPQISKTSGKTWAVALLFTLLVFLALPLTQMMSASRQKNLDLVSIESELPPPPPPPSEPEPEPEEEPEPEPEELQEDNALPPLSLGQLEMSLDGGMGSGVGIGLGMQTASNLVAQINVFELSDVDKAPTATMMIHPTYPPKLQRDRVEGTVVLVFVLDEKGRVQDPRVESSSNSGFERAAVEAVKQWMFEPAVKDGKPVRARLRQPLRFRL